MHSRSLPVPASSPDARRVVARRSRNRRRRRTPSPSSVEPASHTGTAAPAAAPASCETEFLQSLPLRRKLAQLLNVGVTGTADAAQVVRDEQVGGIFVGSWTDESMLANREIPQVASASSLPLMVTIDEEGGRVSRVENLLGADPSARQTAATMTEEQTYQMALERGRGAEGPRCHRELRPRRGREQPARRFSVIGDRSYSDDPAVVTRYADAVCARDAGRGNPARHQALPRPRIGVRRLAHRGRHHPAARAVADEGPRAVPEPGVHRCRRHARPSRGAGSDRTGCPRQHQSRRRWRCCAAAPDTARRRSPARSSPTTSSGMAGDHRQLRHHGRGRGRAGIAGADVALWITTDDGPAGARPPRKACGLGQLPQQRVDESVLPSRESRACWPASARSATGCWYSSRPPIGPALLTVE